MTSLNEVCIYNNSSSRRRHRQPADDIEFMNELGGSPRRRAAALTNRLRRFFSNRISRALHRICDE